MISRQHDVRHWPVGDSQGGAHRPKHRFASVALATILAETLLISGSVAATSASTPSTGVNPANYSAGSSAFRMGNVPWSSSISLNPYNPDFVHDGNLALFALAAFFDHARPGANP